MVCYCRTSDKLKLTATRRATLLTKTQDQATPGPGAGCDGVVSCLKRGAGGKQQEGGGRGEEAWAHNLLPAGASAGALALAGLARKLRKKSSA